MLTRSSFWLGLLLGLLSALFSRPARPSTPPVVGPDPLLDLVADAVLVCDSSGAITYANAAARTLFGPDGGWLAQLCYPSGQPMPPGQMPLRRVLGAGLRVQGSYLLPGHHTEPRILDVMARPCPGGAVAVIRDISLSRREQARASATAGRVETLATLGARLSAATESEEAYSIIVQAARALLADLPAVRVRLYVYDAESKRLTRLVSAPDDRPKRPRSERQPLPPTFAFDAGDPLLWQVYVAKQVYRGPCTVSQGEESDCSACALPLVADNVVVGHLSLTSPDASGLADADRQQALAGLAALAAWALAGRREAAQAQASAAQMAAVREVAQAAAGEGDLGALADLAAGHVCRLTGAEVCTLAVRDGDGLRLVGEAYRDALLFPDRHTPGDAALRENGLEDALRDRKTTQRLGRANPALEAGPWRAFAGQSGRHSVLTVPLPGGQGGWTVYWAGAAPLGDGQVKFVETLALLTPAMPLAAHTGH